MDKKEIYINLMRKIYLSRASETAIINEYANDEMKTPMHMSYGQEVIPAAVLEVLGERAQVFTSYRSHAPYLMRTEDFKGFFAEMYGKETGIVGGRGGSMHLSNPDKGFILSSAIVASQIPLAVGLAYVNKLKQNNKIAVVFFGDGAINEGIFWESLNLAALKGLPVLFVCEDNDIAVHTPKELRNGFGNLEKVLEQFNVIVDEDFSDNVFNPMHLYHRVKSVVEWMDKEKCPGLVNYRTYRYLEHVGVNFDFEAGYRNKKEFEKISALDPLFMYEQVRPDSEVDILPDLFNEIDEEIETAILEAKQAKFPTL